MYPGINYKKKIGHVTFGLWTDRRDRAVDCGRVLYGKSTKWWAALGPVHLYVEVSKRVAV